jgi:NAD(P)-dependent dehydrogenase (short-subunit alcohol dehydrogenase family)
MPLNPRIADWHGRVAWIVGASSGIGRATAAALHARGATVIASARQAGDLAQLAAGRPGLTALPLDVTDRDAVQCAGHRVQALHGQLDLLLHCAGHYRALRATEFDLDEMLRHQQVNYVGALHLLDAVLPGMLAARRGHISLVASVAGYRGLPNALAYGPTKAALQNLADVLYLDLHERGIGVSVVNPGFVRTALTAANGFRMPALLTPEQAAAEIVRGWERGRFEIHFPRRFTLWLKMLSHLGHGLYFAAVQRATGL